MIRKIWTSGKTLVITIPQDTATMKNLQDGDIIEIEIKNIRKATPNDQKYNIEELK